MSERCGLQTSGLNRNSYQTLDIGVGDEKEDWAENLMSCAASVLPRPSEAWPASFNASAALYLRQAPTTDALEERDGIWATRMAWGSPGQARDRRATSIQPQRTRGFSDDALILRLNLSLHDAKLSDTSWLTKAQQRRDERDETQVAGPTVGERQLKPGTSPESTAPLSPDRTQDLKAHPSIRKFRNEYSNWRKGMSKGSKGELKVQVVETTQSRAAEEERFSAKRGGGFSTEPSGSASQGLHGFGAQELHLSSAASHESPDDDDTTDGSSSRWPHSGGSGGVGGVSGHSTTDLEALLKGRPVWSGSQELHLSDGSTAEPLREIPPFESVERAEPSPVRSPTILAEIPPFVPKEEEREEEGSSLAQTVFNGINALLGLVLLAMPAAMVEIGWLFLPIYAALFFMSLATLDVLDACQTRTGAVSFPDIVDAAFGPSGRWLAGFMAYVDMFAMGIGCMIVTARSLEELAKSVWGDSSLSTSMCMWGVALALAPTCFLRDLKLVSYLSMGGLGATFATIALIIAQALSDVQEEGDEVEGSESVAGLGVALVRSAEENTSLVGSQPFLPLSLLLYQFSFQGLFPSLRSSMAKPAEARTMARLVLTVCSAAVAVPTVLCYVVFGPGVSEQVTTELGGWFGTLANWLVLLTSYSKFPLGLFPICDAIIELLPPTHAASELTQVKPHEHHHRPSASNNSNATMMTVRLTRCVALAFTFVVAVTCPGFSAVIGFFTWIFGPFLMVALPLASYIRLFPEEAAANPLAHRCRQTAVVVSAVVSVIGTLAPVFGVFLGRQ